MLQLCAARARRGEGPGLARARTPRAGPLCGVRPEVVQPRQCPPVGRRPRDLED